METLDSKDVPYVPVVFFLTDVGSRQREAPEPPVAVSLVLQLLPR